MHIFFSVGEPSGDLHGANLIRQLRQRGPLIADGLGGPKMRAAGCELMRDMSDLALMGLFPVRAKLRELWSLLSQVERSLDEDRPDAVVLIDYPAFNMKVAEAATAAGVPVLYYITPQVWAWGSDRLDRLARTVTKAAVILPFEEDLLRRHKIDATFVGHPLMDSIDRLPDRDAARATLGLSPSDRVLALFPGSREQEIERHLDAFVGAARELQRRDPSLKVLVSVAPHVTVSDARCPFPMVRSASFTIFRAADAALCKSGTTTLEAAVTGCPLVVAYRTSPITYAAARWLVKIPNIGLVNVVAGHRLAPEFVQDALQPFAVADALSPLLDHESDERKLMIVGLDAVRAALGTPGAAARAATMAAELAGHGGNGR